MSDAEWGRFLIAGFIIFETLAQGGVFSAERFHAGSFQVELTGKAVKRLGKGTGIFAVTDIAAGLFVGTEFVFHGGSFLVGGPMWASAPTKFLLRSYIPGRATREAVVEISMEGSERIFS